MDLSFISFANRDAANASREYDLVFKTAAFADDHGFTAVWLPERHFHPFGGAFPNPAVVAAAIAARTRRVRLRAGSVVLPLHDPLRVAEDWAVVDQLSQGRVDISVAPGFMADDFVLAPDRYAERRHHLADAVDVLASAWRGEPVQRVNGDGAAVEITTFPRPMQPELDLWLTCGSTRESFEAAGARGLNVLTALLFQRVEDVGPKIAAYREARRAHGFDPDAGKVTLMLHTFVGESDEEVRALVRPAFLEYLDASVDLWRRQWHDLGALDRSQLLEFAFERYFRTSGLLGSVERCASFATTLAGAGVDEIACLVDFGVASEAVVASLPALAELHRRLPVGRDGADATVG
jgi:natural product biosynthesis luciferase-like monooxygenase protein